MSVHWPPKTLGKSCSLTDSFHFRSLVLIHWRHFSPFYFCPLYVPLEFPCHYRNPYQQKGGNQKRKISYIIYSLEAPCQKSTRPSVVLGLQASISFYVWVKELHLDRGNKKGSAAQHWLLQQQKECCLNAPSATRIDDSAVLAPASCSKLWQGTPPRAVSQDPTWLTDAPCPDLFAPLAAVFPGRRSCTTQYVNEILGTDFGDLAVLSLC